MEAAGDLVLCIDPLKQAVAAVDALGPAILRQATASPTDAAVALLKL
jgi:hypothetical protein